MRKLKLPGRGKKQPHLDQNDMALIRKVGIDEIRDQVEQVVKEKLKEPNADPSIPKAGNPVYKSMYACRADSRDRLFMSHRIRPDHELTKSQMGSVSDMLIRWIVREYNFYQEEEQKMKEDNMRLADFFME